MCQFVETIRIEHGVAARLALHQERLQRTLQHFAPQCVAPQLTDLLADCPKEGLLKARVLYDTTGNMQTEYHPYALRCLKSLRFVANDEVDYAFKYANRGPLTALQAQRGDYDEVLIVRRGLITDTSYTNVAFTDGHSWFTPRIPLLPGTMRRYLLEMGMLTECDIRPEDVTQFTHVALFNAMIDFRKIVLPCSNIGW